MTKKSRPKADLREIVASRIADLDFRLGRAESGTAVLDLLEAGADWWWITRAGLRLPDPVTLEWVENEIESIKELHLPSRRAERAVEIERELRALGVTETPLVPSDLGELLDDARVRAGAGEGAHVSPEELSALHRVNRLREELQEVRHRGLYPAEVEVMIRVLGLYAGVIRCRAAIEAGDVQRVAVCMAMAMRSWHEIVPRLQEIEDRESLEETSRLTGSAGGRARAQKAAARNERWLVDFERLKANHPRWSREQIYCEIGEKSDPKRSPSAVGKAIRRMLAAHPKR